MLLLPSLDFVTQRCFDHKTIVRPNPCDYVILSRKGSYVSYGAIATAVVSLRNAVCVYLQADNIFNPDSVYEEEFFMIRRCFRRL